MTLTELTFGLSALILGLALTHIAATLSKLLLARERVRWAPEPLILATIVLMVVVFVWLNQWEARVQTAVIYWRVLLQKLSFLSLYVAASVCLPDATAEPGLVDLHAYYDRTRRLSFGALIVSLLLLNAYFLGEVDRSHWTEIMVGTPLICLPYGIMMFVRWRWLNVLLLLLILILWGSNIMTYQIKQ